MTDRWPLTALEEYLLLEDRTAYPWSFFVRLHCAGCADRQAAEAALCRSVARHPLLCSTVQRQGDGSWVWRRVAEPQPRVDWTDGIGQRAYAFATHLDVSAEIGVRLRAAVGSEATQCIFQFHHACCDARGAFQLVEDWLAEYACATGERRDAALFRSYDPGLLQRRDRPGAPLQPAGGKLPTLVAALGRAYQFLCRQGVPLLDYPAACDEDPTPADFPAARSFRFDAATTAELRAAAKRQGATVNDLLCRDLFLVLHRFRQESQPPPPDAWLRLAVPVDLRSQAEGLMSAANQASMVFVTRRASACQAAAALLLSIHRELQQVKTRGLARTFLRSLQLRRRLPGGLPRSVRSRKYSATAALTNVGETLTASRLPRRDGKLVAGNLLLEAADFLAPIRPLTCVSFSACTYAGQLAISLQYDPRAFSDPAADRLFQAFLAQLQSSLR